MDKQEAFLRIFLKMKKKFAKRKFWEKFFFTCKKFYNLQKQTGHPTSHHTHSRPESEPLSQQPTDEQAVPNMP